MRERKTDSLQSKWETHTGGQTENKRKRDNNRVTDGQQRESKIQREMGGDTETEGQNGEREGLTK